MATLMRSSALLISSSSAFLTPHIRHRPGIPFLRCLALQSNAGGRLLSVVLPLQPPSSLRRRAWCSCVPPSGMAASPVAITSPAPSSTLESPSPSSDPIKDAADALDIRVGYIIKAWRHPEADSLYVEEVDVGEEEPRTICSGLVNYIPLESLQDIKVVVLANLKPRNMRGVKSYGMLMAASDVSHETVELLIPPEGSVPGERIWFGSEEEQGQQPNAATPNQVQKKKLWESVQPHLKTTDACVAVLGERPMRTSAGVVVCSSLKNANIS
ncbi:putative tyrosine--tRNA ligase [Dioscorea sansibarensis]